MYTDAAPRCHAGTEPKHRAGRPLRLPVRARRAYAGGVSRTARAIVFAGGLGVELLIALAWWWRPEHARLWAIAAGAVIVIAAIVDHGARR